MLLFESIGLRNVKSIIFLLPLMYVKKILFLHTIIKKSVCECQKAQYLCSRKQ